MDLTPHLKVLTEKKAESLVFKGGAPAQLIIAGKFKAIGNELSASNIKTIASEVLNDAQKKHLVQHNNINAFYSTPDFGDFVVSVAIIGGGIVISINPEVSEETTLIEFESDAVVKLEQEQVKQKHLLELAEEENKRLQEQDLESEFKALVEKNQATAKAEPQIRAEAAVLPQSGQEPAKTNSPAVQITQSDSNLESLSAELDEQLGDYQPSLDGLADTVIEISLEEALEYQPKPELWTATEGETKAEPELEYQPKPELLTSTEIETKAEPELDYQPKPELLANSEPEIKSEPELEYQPNPANVPEAVVFTEPTPAYQPAAVPTPESPTQQPAAKAEPAPQQNSEQKPEPKPEIVPEPKSETATKPMPPVTPAKAEPEPTNPEHAPNASLGLDEELAIPRADEDKSETSKPSAKNVPDIEVLGQAPASGNLDVLPYLRKVIELDGSDLFLTVDSPVKAKVSGVAIKLDNFMLTPELTQSAVFGIMTDKQIEEFQTTHDLDFAIAMPDGSARFRANAFYQRRTIGLVMRLIPSVIPTAEQLNLPEILLEMIMAKRGLLLMVGGTGSGKSTTLAAMINYRNANSPGHILTIEDPVEFSHPNQMSIVNQREVGVDTASYARALKASLREAPDVILIGEIRDRETMEAALELANTGHLCISTLHANNANQAMERIVNMFPHVQHKQLFMDIATNLRGVVSQRLIPDVRGKRCAAIEVMINTPNIANLILKGELHEIKGAMAGSGSKGMKTFDTALYDLYKAGKISMEEALKNADSRNDLEAKMNFG